MALERLVGLVAALLMAAAAVATMNALILLFEAGASRRREVAIRGAVGATPRTVVILLFRRVRTVLATGAGLGILLGLLIGSAVRTSWPGELETTELMGATGEILPALVALMSVAAGAYLWMGLVTGGRPIAPALLDGGRSTAGRGDAARRRILSALQLGAAGTVVLGTMALSRAVVAGAGSDIADEEAVAISVSFPDGSSGEGWREVLDRLGALPGMRAESLASHGAVVGLGVRDYATAHCGACSRGGLPLPFWGALADHHSVSPGFFEATGLTVLDGRGFGDGDDGSAPRVAVVNQTFAHSSFQEGKPVGRRIRVGTELDAWYTVVGVVEDVPVGAVGGDDIAREVVYLSALQHPPDSGNLLLTGAEPAVSAAHADLAQLGFDPGDPVTLREFRSRSMDPLRWTTRMALILAFVTLILALHGAHTTALVVTRRRFRELAVRRVMGAKDHQILRLVFLGGAKTALGGAVLAVLFGSGAVALLRKSAGDVPSLGVGSYVGVAALLVGASLLASRRAADEALSVEPGTAVE
jgi:putative ABC transport system permease protein